MAALAASKDGLFQHNFCLFLEGRFPFIYRTNLLFNIFEIISFVKEGNVLVNNLLINYVNYVILTGDFITFYKDNAAKFKSNFYRRFKTHTVLFSTPRFMFVDYKLFFAFFEKQITEKDLIYPIKLDIYRATAYIKIVN